MRQRTETLGGMRATVTITIEKVGTRSIVVGNQSYPAVPVLSVAMAALDYDEALEKAMRVLAGEQEFRSDQQAEAELTRTSAPLPSLPEFDDEEDGGGEPS